jgi:hypothetical protein
MDSIINFFALRPTFTVVGLKAVWYLYLASAVVQTYFTVSAVLQAMAQRGISFEVGAPSLLPMFLGVIAQVALVRLLIEVAAIVISSQSSRPT